MLIASDAQAIVADHAFDHDTDHAVDQGTGPFVIDLAKQPNHFRQLKNVQFDVSSRLVVPEANILDYLKTYFMYLNQDQIARYLAMWFIRPNSMADALTIWRTR